jgi:hypothetical protein
MRSVVRNCEIVTEAGYECLDGFVLPEKDWWENYYGPAEARVRELRRKYAGDAEAIATLDEAQVEYDLFRDHSDAYGYVFYVMRKPAH